MATHDKTVGSAGIPTVSIGRDYVLTNRIDLSGISGLAAADVVQAINVMAGTLVRKVLTRIITPTVNAGGNTTAEVGDGADPNGYDTTVDLEAAAGTVAKTGLGLTEGTPNTLTDAYAGGKVYTEADTIDLVVGISAGTPTFGEIEVIALCTRVY